MVLALVIYMECVLNILLVHLQTNLLKSILHNLLKMVFMHQGLGISLRQ